MVMFCHTMQCGGQRFSHHDLPQKVKGFAHFVFGNAAAPRGINGVRCRCSSICFKLSSRCRAGFCGATKLPRPGMVVIKPSASRSSYARLVVITLMRSSFRQQADAGQCIALLQFAVQNFGFDLPGDR